MKRILLIWIALHKPNIAKVKTIYKLTKKYLLIQARINSHFLENQKMDILVWVVKSSRNFIPRYEFPLSLSFGLQTEIL